LLLAQGEAENQAERTFGRAIEISRQQGARSLELRATMSLAHLWHKQGKKARGRKLLQETYRWFSEGFDTPDLKKPELFWKTFPEPIGQPESALPP
jgi:hypothetical protein